MPSPMIVLECSNKQSHGTILSGLVPFLTPQVLVVKILFKRETRHIIQQPRKTLFTAASIDEPQQAAALVFPMKVSPWQYKDNS